MTDTETLSMWQLEKDIRQEVRDEAQNLLDSRYPEDMIHEWADSHVPVYTTDLMELAASDIALATDEPEVGPGFDGSPTPVNIIVANVYERLWRAASNEWIDIQAETEDCSNCGVSAFEDDMVLVNVEASTHDYPGYPGDLYCKECAEAE